MRDGITSIAETKAMIRKRILRIAFIHLAVIALPAVGIVDQALSAETVPVGVAEVDITPETPIRMYGYGARKTESEGIAGRLKAKALAIGSGEGDGLAVMLCVDCGAVPMGLRNRMFQQVTAKNPITPERFVLCNSHNHSGPNLKGMDSISGDEHERLANYARQLEKHLVDVVLKAIKARQPCQLAFAQGTVDFAANRRVLKDGKWSGFGAVPDGAVDHSLSVLKVTREDGTVLALVAGYACHCTTLRGNFKQIHGDWAACAQQYIEEDHPGAMAMITIGCGADADPCPHGTVALCERHGRALADEVKRLVGGSWKPIDLNLAARRNGLTVPHLVKPAPEQVKQAAGRSGWAQEGIGSPAKVPPAESFCIVTWTFGNDLAMVSFSDEVVVDYASRLKRELDASRLWINAYSNDVSCYIVSKRLITEGGYEVRNSLSSRVTHGQPEKLDPAMEDRVVECVKSMLPVSFHASTH